MTAKPFLKWAGGKSKLVPEILKRVPENFRGTYFEPFLGGGAVFFALPTHVQVNACLSDANAELMTTYKAIRNDVGQVVAILDELQPHVNADTYAKVRAMNNPLDDAGTAARMIYLNKCGFNGLYRVNSRGKFNTPWGKKAPTTNLYEGANIRACSNALTYAKLDAYVFEKMADLPMAGDFVYLDPPYVPVSGTADFTAYTKDGFDHVDQEHLVDTARTWKARGVHVLISNAGTDEVRELYHGFKVETVQMRRNINSNGAKRGPVEEFLIS